MREIQFREALREAMQEEMRTDSTVFLIGEEVAEYNGAYKVSQGMLDEFGPERVIDTPIAELGFGGISVGAAANGLRPIVEFMTFNFSLVAIDQVINSASKIMSMSGGQYSCPIVFRGPTGNAGQLSSQHSSNFENWFANTPGLKVLVSIKLLFIVLRTQLSNRFTLLPELTSAKPVLVVPTGADALTP